MTGRRPARLLAPLALVACAVALFTVVSSGGGDESTATSTSGSARPSATATPSAKNRRSSTARSAGRRRSYTIKRGDTPSGIAEATGVSVQALLAANPDADATALSPGQVLKLPAK